MYKWEYVDIPIIINFRDGTLGPDDLAGVKDSNPNDIRRR